MSKSAQTTRAWADRLFGLEGLLMLAAAAVAVMAWDVRISILLGVWLGAWLLNQGLSQIGGRWVMRLVPVIFGVTLLVLWQMAVSMFAVPTVILPGPLAIAARFAGSLDVLWGDFVQTFVKGALSGYVMGCGAAVLTAIAVDRSVFLQRGLLPVGNFVAALPVVGIAPILVMWFGFDWQSKAAVVVVMVFFPMLVNTVAGLRATDAMQRDLMATYSASYWQSLFKLRLPAAMPFLFNGLKIATTLAMIGAIVAEFFGSPTQGMGFRISTEVGRLGLDMVWSEIAVAALAGSAFYGVVAMIEKGVTFWHPSQRGR
jgi:NitT/TauT family transport system permease protein